MDRIPCLIGATLSMVLMSGCGVSTPDPSPKSPPVAKNSEGGSDNPTTTHTPLPNSPDTPDTGGTMIDTPGSSAAIKPFTGVVPSGKFKSIFITANNFPQEPKVVESANKADLEILWMFLAESQNIVDRDADQTMPKKISKAPESLELVFHQTNTCNSLTRLEINNRVEYRVDGSCVTLFKIDIPIKFTSNLYLNHKLIHKGYTYPQ